MGLTAKFPNVVFVAGFGDEDIEPISHDNSTMPVIKAAQTSRLNGLYQYHPMFYHKSMDRFIPWEERGKSMIFSCSFYCGPMNTSGKDVMLALVHMSHEPKKHLWYLLELTDEDANSPILYARSKFRKTVSYGSPWVTMTPGGDIKSKDLKNVYVF